MHVITTIGKYILVMIYRKEEPTKPVWKPPPPVPREQEAPIASPRQHAANSRPPKPPRLAESPVTAPNRRSPRLARMESGSNVNDAFSFGTGNKAASPARYVRTRVSLNIAGSLHQSCCLVRRLLCYGEAVGLGFFTSYGTTRSPRGRF